MAVGDSQQWLLPRFVKELKPKRLRRMSNLMSFFVVTPSERTYNIATALEYTHHSNSQGPCYGLTSKLGAAAKC